MHHIWTSGSVYTPQATQSGWEGIQNLGQRAKRELIGAIRALGALLLADWSLVTASPHLSYGQYLW